MEVYQYMGDEDKKELYVSIPDLVREMKVYCDEISYSEINLYWERLDMEGCSGFFDELVLWRLGEYRGLNDSEKIDHMFFVVDRFGMGLGEDFFLFGLFV